MLLSEGANPSPRNSHKATPLHFAARLGYEYLVRNLIEHEADVTARDSLDRTPTCIAVQKGHSGIGRILSKVRSSGDVSDEQYEVQRLVDDASNTGLSEAKLPKSLIVHSLEKSRSILSISCPSSASP